MRLKTGISALDDMLNGGFHHESINLVEGRPGTGKSTLATHFILEGIRNGENGAYISLEEEKHSFFTNMGSYGWALKGYEEEGSLYYEFFRTEEILCHIKDGYQHIDRELRRIKAKRLVIDSVTAYLLASDTELSRRNELKRLFDHIHRWRLTALLVGESYPEEGGIGLDYLVDSIVRLRHTKNGKKRQRQIEVEKMRGSKHSLKTRTMKITDKGIIVEADD